MALSSSSGTKLVPPPGAPSLARPLVLLVGAIPDTAACPVYSAKKAQVLTDPPRISACAAINGVLGSGLWRCADNVFLTSLPIPLPFSPTNPFTPLPQLPPLPQLSPYPDSDNASTALKDH